MPTVRGALMVASSEPLSREPRTAPSTVNDHPGGPEMTVKNVISSSPVGVSAVLLFAGAHGRAGIAYPLV